MRFVKVLSIVSDGLPLAILRYPLITIARNVDDKMVHFCGETTGLNSDNSTYAAKMHVGYSNSIDLTVAHFIPLWTTDCTM